MRRQIRRAFNAFGFDIARTPWQRDEAFGALVARVQAEVPISASVGRCWILYSLARQAARLAGEFWECGVYKGGTALLLAHVLAAGAGEPPPLRLFDTFAGMPPTDPDRDRHRAGDFGDTSLAAVRRRLPAAFVAFHPGRLPETFRGLEGAAIAMAHVDVDIYRSVLDCCEFIYPRLVAGGVLLFDDYGFPTCPGARQAVDEFFAGRPEVPLCLPTGQAVVFRLPAPGAPPLAPAGP